MAYQTDHPAPKLRGRKVTYEYKDRAVTVLMWDDIRQQVRVMYEGDEEYDAFWLSAAKVKEILSADEKLHLRSFLQIAESKPDFATFIDYLRTPAAEAKLYFKARCLEDAPALQDQYRDLSAGDELVEGRGYAVMDTNKWSNEGLVSFRPLSEYPPAIKELLAPNHDGLINHIQFVWLLVKEGFKVRRDVL